MGAYILQIFCSLLLLPMLGLRAQDTAYFSLEEIIAKVEAEYPQVLEYEAKIKSLQFRERGSTSWMPPSFSFGLNSFPYRLDMIRSENDPMNWAAYMFTLEQMIPNGAKLRAKKAYYASLQAVEQSKADWTKNELRLQVRTLYYQRLVAERKLMLIEENRQLLSLFIRISEPRYTYNQARLNTIFKARAKLAELANMETMAHAEIKESTIGLNVFMNRQIHEAFRIDTSLSFTRYGDRMVGEDTATLTRSDIQAMNKGIHAMERNRVWMLSGYKPDFGLRLSHMNMLGMPDQFSIMGMITIPLVPWASRMVKSEVGAMSYEILAMKRARESMQRMARRMIHDKLAMLQYAGQQYDNYREYIIPAYRKNLEASLLAYQENTESFFVLLDAWEMLLMKRLEELELAGRLLRLQAEYEYETERR